MPRAATAPSARKTAARGTPASSTRLVILVATRKGAWLFHGDARRKAWTADGPHFLGHNCSRRAMPASATPGTPALRRRACSARRTAA